MSDLSTSAGKKKSELLLSFQIQTSANTFLDSRTAQGYLMPIVILALLSAASFTCPSAGCMTKSYSWLIHGWP